MKYEVVPNSCRVCLRQRKKLRSLYKPLEEGDEIPAEMFQLCTGVDLEDEYVKTSLPKSICKSCELSLNLAFQFRTLALKSQRIIENHQLGRRKEFVSREDSDSAEVKEEMEEFIDTRDCLEEQLLQQENESIDYSTEMKIEDLEVPFDDDDYDGSDGKAEYLDDSYMDINEFDIEDNNEYETHYKTAIEICSTSATSSNEFTCSKSQYRVNNDTETLEDLLEGEPKRTRCERTSAKVHKTKTAEYDIEDIKKRLIEANGNKYEVVQVDCGKRGELPTLKVIATHNRKAKKVDEEGGHICDICGNIYPKRGRMMEHRRRHDKELRYACELCDKRFHLREMLRKHMFSHSGGKPFKCSFCSRTFFYESVKKSHEAIHSGHKPYVCEVCNKAFAYPHTLKKHLLIHDDIKLYHCEYCDKDFRLQHHIKQHEETKLHQTNVRNAVAEAKKAKMSAIEY